MLGSIQLVLTKHSMIYFHLSEVLAGIVVSAKLPKMKAIDILHVQSCDTRGLVRKKWVTNSFIVGFPVGFIKDI